jgi:hypothetical protein
MGNVRVDLCSLNQTPNTKEQEKVIEGHERSTGALAEVAKCKFLAAKRDNLSKVFFLLILVQFEQNESLSRSKS